MDDDMGMYQYDSYWELQNLNFLDSTEELNQRNWGIDEACLGFNTFTSSADQGAASSGAAVNKSVINERNRRKKMNASICRLRSIVPRISKAHGQGVNDQRRHRVYSGIARTGTTTRSRNLDAASHRTSRGASESSNHNNNSYNYSNYPSLSPEIWMLPPIELLELKVEEIGESSHLVSMTCNKKNGTMSSVCEVLGYLDLKIITSNITTISGSIMFTLTVQTEELITSSQLREKIRNGILVINELRRQ